MITKKECDKKRMNYDLVKNRLRKGWTKEEAFGLSSVTDHKGNLFYSTKEMCVAWGMDSETFDRRRRKGWTTLDALTTPIGRNFTVTDHLGRSFDSLTLMAAAYGIDNCTLRTRLKSGWSLEEALTVPVRHYTYRYVEDHLGRVFCNVSEMCSYWGVSRSAYDLRKKRGWDLEKILTTPKDTPKPVKDHIGAEYKSFRCMCKTWQKEPATVRDRLQKGATLKEALTTPVAKRIFHTHLHV